MLGVTCPYIMHRGNLAARNVSDILSTTHDPGTHESTYLGVDPV